MRHLSVQSNYFLKQVFSSKPLSLENILSLSFDFQDQPRKGHTAAKANNGFHIQACFAQRQAPTKQQSEGVVFARSLYSQRSNNKCKQSPNTKHPNSESIFRKTTSRQKTKKSISKSINEPKSNFLIGRVVVSLPMIIYLNIVYVYLYIYIYM